MFVNQTQNELFEQLNRVCNEGKSPTTHFLRDILGCNQVHTRLEDILKFPELSKGVNSPIKNNSETSLNTKFKSDFLPQLSTHTLGGINIDSYIYNDHVIEFGQLYSDPQNTLTNIRSTSSNINNVYELPKFNNPFINHEDDINLWCVDELLHRQTENAKKIEKQKSNSTEEVGTIKWLYECIKHHPSDTTLHEYNNTIKALSSTFSYITFEETDDDLVDKLCGLFNYEFLDNISLIITHKNKLLSEFHTLDEAYKITHTQSKPYFDYFKMKSSPNKQIKPNYTLEDFINVLVDYFPHNEPHTHQDNYYTQNNGLNNQAKSAVKTELFQSFMADEVIIPPPIAIEVNTHQLHTLDILPEWARPAFKSVTHFNPVQSKVFQAAFYESKNLLISAPTGAGKTNIALLTILNALSGHLNTHNKVKPADEFKIVYIAPMKSLVGEIVDKFSRALSYLGVVVNEMSGDMQLSTTERNDTHILVTVPEKWDVLTRNSYIHRNQSNQTILSIVKLLILDEIHLLNEDRGSVLEAIIARTLQNMERVQIIHRLVAISATMPNWQDVSEFMRVEPSMAFYFGPEYRPVPLEQFFIGVKGKSKTAHTYLNLQFHEKVVKFLESEQQIMVFVHSRSSTSTSARHLIQFFRDSKTHLLHLLKPDDMPNEYNVLHKKLLESKFPQLLEYFQYGIGIHHAGMARSDRNLMEKLFSTGILRILFCTATLAWGVNLPARSVIIKGTKIFDSLKGGFKDIGILDVLQMFGRAGRPQFDKMGTAGLICEHDLLSNYVRAITNQSPIESKMETSLSNNLNAEIAMGNINNLSSASEWILYTFLYVRMKNSPQSYHISIDDDDHLLTNTRMKLVIDAVTNLDKYRLIRFSRNTCELTATELGRIAAKFYVDYETIGIYSNELKSDINDSTILHIFGQSKEFANMKVRAEELNELDQLSHTSYCKIKPREGAEENVRKVVILLQVALNRLFPNDFNLISDYNLILSSASRLFRAMYETCFTDSCDCSPIAERLLEWTKMVDWKIRDDQNLLRHFVKDNEGVYRQRDDGRYINKASVIKIEQSKMSVDRLMEMSFSEIKSVVHTPSEASKIERLMRHLPFLETKLSIQPITATIIKITLAISLHTKMVWSDFWNGNFEPYVFWVENFDDGTILYRDTLNLEPILRSKEISFMVPIHDPRPSQCVIKVISDKWVNVSTYESFSINNLLDPENRSAHTPLLDLRPLPVSALNNELFEDFYKFEYFNSIQTQIFHTCYHTDNNVLLGAPTGSGKTVAAEFTLFRLFQHSAGGKAVYIAPLKALANERMKDWSKRFNEILGRVVLELTGDHSHDKESLDNADLIITTPEKWDGITRFWKERKYIQKVDLLIIDEIHLLGQDRGPILEAIISRMRYMCTQLSKVIRFVGLSTALANAYDIADWLGVNRYGFYNFRPSIRPVPCEVHISGFSEKHYCPRMASMNKPLFLSILQHSPNKPVLIFVSSRRQTRLTAYDLINLTSTECDAYKFLNLKHPDISQFLENDLQTILDNDLKHCLGYGIGLHHAGLKESDRQAVEEFYLKGYIQVLIATTTVAWGVNFPSHLVIIKGTEFYDTKLNRYVDFPITDILQMIGRAGRPQFDTSAVACLLVQATKKNFYKRFLYEPFPVESNFVEYVNDYINAEIATGVITCREEAIHCLSWTYFYRRLSSNPSYYDPDVFLSKNEDISKHGESSTIAKYIDKIITNSLVELSNSKCIEISNPNTGNVFTPQKNVLKGNVGITPTHLGKIASMYYLSYKTVEFLNQKLKFDENGEQLNFTQLMETLCGCVEYDGIPIRHNEELLNEQLSKQCPFSINPNSYDDPHTKAFLLLQSHIFGIELPIVDYHTDLISVLNQSIRIIQAMIDISLQEAELTYALNLILLIQCLQQATYPTASSLSIFPCFKNLDVYTHFEQRNIIDLPQLIEAENSTELLSQLPTNFRKEIIDISKHIPRFDSHISIYVLDAHNLTFPAQRIPLEDNVYQRAKKITPPTGFYAGYLIPYNSPLQLIFSFEFIGPIVHTSYTPNFPNKRRPGWYVVVGDTDKNCDELIALKRFSPSKKKSKLTIPINSPIEPDSVYCLSVMFCSDCYFGIDRQFDLLIQTYPQAN